MAQVALDGLIVPFTSALPACASQCGPLFDAQGRCTPPEIATVDEDCFCADTKIVPLQSGTSSVSSICGPASCTSEADLKIIQKWYTHLCQSPTTSNENGGSLSNDNSSRQQSWISGHYKWVILLIVIFLIIIVAWIVACILRRRYLRKREKNYEMADPVAWGPHQLQSATGGYNSNLANTVRPVMIKKTSPAKC